MPRWRCSAAETTGWPVARVGVGAALAVLLAGGCGEAPAPGAGTATPGGSEGAAAPAPPQRLRAVGHEPGWRLDLEAGRLRLLADFGERRVEVAAPAAVPAAQGWRYAARTAGGELTVTVTARVCHDIATGMPHPLTVVVVDHGRRLDGCGGEPASLLHGDWRVVSIGGQPPDPAAAVTIGFGADGRLHGQGPCSALAGGWVLHGEGLALAPAVQTPPTCPEPQARLEQRWLTLLAATYRFAIGADGALALVAPDAQVLARRP